MSNHRIIGAQDPAPHSGDSTVYYTTDGYYAAEGGEIKKLARMTDVEGEVVANYGESEDGKGQDAEGALQQHLAGLDDVTKAVELDRSFRRGVLARIPGQSHFFYEEIREGRVNLYMVRNGVLSFQNQADSLFQAVAWAHREVTPCPNWWADYVTDELRPF